MNYDHVGHHCNRCFGSDRCICPWLASAAGDRDFGTAAFVDLFRRRSKGAEAEPSGAVAESPKASPLTLS